MYPLDETKLAELKKLLALLLKSNHIELGNSPYSTPVLFVQKKIVNYISSWTIKH